MNVSVGLIERAAAVDVVLHGRYRNAAGGVFEGAQQLTAPVEWFPADPLTSAFSVDMVIGRNFHWERVERQTFRGALRTVAADGLTLINDVPIEEYVTSVISSEMSAACPSELLKAHAVISRGWLRHPHDPHAPRGQGNYESVRPDEILRWYGRESHSEFDVCPDDHCQRYQGITKVFTPGAASAVRATSGEVLRYDGAVCDARFSKCCGGIVERFRSAWDDRDVPYLVSFYDGVGLPPDLPIETWLTTEVPAWCNTSSPELIAAILPGFDQETRDFFRWRVEYSEPELREVLRQRMGLDIGEIQRLEAIERGPSGRIVRLEVRATCGVVAIGKELEIRRALSRSHLYSSAFVVDHLPGKFVLRGAGWGHGVGLCQIGAAVMASAGKTYREILSHYYPGAEIGIL